MPPKKFASIKDYNDFIKKYNLKALKGQVYVNTRTKIKHKCLICGYIRTIIPENVPHYSCPNCILQQKGYPVNRSYTKKEVLHTLKQANVKYIYGYKDHFRTRQTKLTVKCSKCKTIYDATLQQILNLKNKGCPYCKEKNHIKNRLSNSEIQRKLNLKFGKNEIRILDEYINNAHSYTFVCKRNHKFTRLFSNVLGSPYACPICFSEKTHNQTSQIAVKVIKLIEKKARLQFLYLPKSDEYRVPNTRFKLDAYNKRFNIGIEFHGSYYHGEYDKTSDAYISTIKRDNKLRRKVNLIVIWEKKYRSNPKSVINHCLKQINKFKLLKQ